MHPTPFPAPSTPTRSPRRLRALLPAGTAAVLAVLTGCATTSTQTVAMPELHVRHEPDTHDGLDVYDAADLYDRGIELADAGELREAAYAFGRVLQEFPKSPDAVPASYRLAEVELGLGHARGAHAALDFYDAHLSKAASGRTKRQGAFRRGEAYALDKDYEKVAEVYDLLLVEPLDDDERVEALVDAGIGHFMRGDTLTSEARLLEARRRFKQGPRKLKLVMRFHNAQAGFYLAELARLEYEAYEVVPTDLAERIRTTDVPTAPTHESETAADGAPRAAADARASVADPDAQGPTLDAEPKDAPSAHSAALPTDGLTGRGSHARDEPGTAAHTVPGAPSVPGNDAAVTQLQSLLGERLEEKCQRLIRAQQKFVRAIRDGHPGWASASGYKVGTMYEALYDDLTTMPAPAELTAPQKELFHSMIRERVRILLQKALRVWEMTASMAGRTGADNVWVERTQESMARVKGLLGDLDAQKAAEARPKTKREAPPLPKS